MRRRTINTLGLLFKNLFLKAIFVAIYYIFVLNFVQVICLALIAFFNAFIVKFIEFIL